MVESRTAASRQGQTKTRPGLALVISCILVMAAGVPGNGVGRSERAGTMQSLRWGVFFEKHVVTPGAGPEGPRRPSQAYDTSVTVIRGRDERPHEVPFETSRADILDGHPMRLQAGFGRIWQIQPQSKDFIPHMAGGGAGDWVDSTPGVKVRGAIGALDLPPEGIVWQLLGGPAVGDLIGSKMPKLRESIEKAETDSRLKPILLYDFAVTSLRTQPRPIDGRPESLVEGILFIHHRYEPERYLIALRFPVGRGEPRWERIAVPFSEPFHCAVDAEDNYYFVTESGRLHSAPRASGDRPRQVKPLFDEPMWHAQALLRDAKTGATTVFVQTQSMGPSDQDVAVQLAPKIDRRPLPASFFAGLEDKPASAVLWKCAELLQDQR